MNKSESIKELACALAKAQGQMGGAHKGKANPFFKSVYADLSSVVTAIREPLSSNGLSFIQATEPSDKDEIRVITMLMHESGEWLSSTIAIHVSKADAQGYGSAITYAKRYSVLAMFGLGTEDDDGNKASNPPTSSPKPATAPKPTETTDTAKCPNCGGQMWDNRPKKASGEFSPASPDFKCRDKACGGVIWPAKDKKIAADGSDYMQSLLN